MFSWSNMPSVAAGSEPSPNSVKQLFELSEAVQHKPICEPGHFGPPAPSETAAQFLPVPMFLQHMHAYISRAVTLHSIVHNTVRYMAERGTSASVAHCQLMRCLLLKTYGSRAMVQERLAATQNAASRNEDVSRFVLGVASCQHSKCA